MSAQVAYAIITRPDDAMRRIRASGGLGTAVMTLICASVSFAVGCALALALLSGGKGAMTLAFFVGWSVLLALVLWVFIGALSHSAACLMGGYGHFAKFLAAYAMASMPFALSAPAALILSPLGGAGASLFVLLVLPILGIWQWFLIVFAIRELYGLSTGVAFVASILPYGLICTVVLLAAMTSFSLMWLTIGV